MKIENMSYDQLTQVFTKVRKLIDAQDKAKRLLVAETYIGRYFKETTDPEYPHASTYYKVVGTNSYGNIVTKRIRTRAGDTMFDHNYEFMTPGSLALGTEEITFEQYRTGVSDLFMELQDKYIGAGS